MDPPIVVACQEMKNGEWAHLAPYGDVTLIIVWWLLLLVMVQK
jgi:hypothetical protein